jgi:TetR/AcrR family transcriptional regulator, tetracycline repressor protein
MDAKTKPIRPTLTRDLVVDTALAIADAQGLEAVSFRRMATEFGVTPMALYRYVESKDELFGAIVDRAFDEFALPRDRTAAWQDQLRELARAFRRVLLAHPAAAALYFVKADTQSFSGLRIVEVVLDVLVAAGFGDDEAALIEGDLERTVLGLVLFETRRASLWASTEEQDARMREMRGRLMALPREEFPRVVASADVLCGSTDRDAAFEFAVDLLIGGLEKLLERRRTNSR